MKFRQLAMRLGRLASVISLLACLMLLWGAWRLTAPAFTGIPLATRSPVAIARTESIRVSLLPEGVRELEIEVSGPFRVKPVGGDGVLYTAERLGRSRVTATARGLRIGQREFATTKLEIVPSNSPAIWVEAHQYRGSVRLYRLSGNLVLAVNALPLEEYLASVVDSEMPAAFPDEARKAQAIVARTYARYQMRQAGSEARSDLYASTRSQKYLGFQYRDPSGRLLAGESAASRRLVEATRGQVCTYKNQILCTYYSAVCGGGTVRGTEVFSDAAPPLQPVRCSWCQEARLYRWTAEITKAEMRDSLKSLLERDGQTLGELQTIVPIRNTGRSLPEFDLHAARQTVRVTGNDLRQALAGHGLYGPRFSITDKGRNWLISGRGHGHGVGLCQWGARGLALEGKTCNEILQHYYPGVRLTTMK
ncbi:MAG: SpoIID/LytB domain-containing protein [Planctomycetales bacterium]